MLVSVAGERLRQPTRRIFAPADRSRTRESPRFYIVTIESDSGYPWERKWGVSAGCDCRHLGALPTGSCWKNDGSPKAGSRDYFSGCVSSGAGIGPAWN